jgi:hypothetical protein
MGHTSPRQWHSSETKRQLRWIKRLFPLALLLAGSVLIGSVPAHASITRKGSCRLAPQNSVSKWAMRSEAYGIGQTVKVSVASKEL